MSILLLDRAHLEVRCEGDALALYESGQRRGTVPVHLLERCVIHGAGTRLDSGGLLRLADRYSHERLEHACLRALRAHKATYGMVTNILRHNLDQLEICPDPNNHISETPTQHQNLRGPEAFQ